MYHNLSTIIIYDSINQFGSRGLAPKIWSTEVGHLALQLVLVQPVSQSSKVTWWFFRVWPWKITVMFRGTSSSRSFPLANGASWFRVHSLRAMGKGPYGYTSSSNPQLMAASALILGKRIPPKGQLASRMFYAQFFFGPTCTSMSGGDADFLVTTCEIVVWSMVSIPVNTTKVCGCLRIYRSSPQFSAFWNHQPVHQRQNHPVLGASSRVWVVSYHIPLMIDHVAPVVGIPGVPGRRTAEQPQICARCFSNCLTLEGCNWIQLEGAPKPWRFSSLSSLRKINQLFMVCVVCVRWFITQVFQAAALVEATNFAKSLVGLKLENDETRGLFLAWITVITLGKF